MSMLFIMSFCCCLFSINLIQTASLMRFLLFPHIHTTIARLKHRGEHQTQQQQPLPHLHSRVQHKISSLLRICILHLCYTYISLCLQPFDMIWSVQEFVCVGSNCNKCDCTCDKDCNPILLQPNLNFPHYLACWLQRQLHEGNICVQDNCQRFCRFEKGKSHRQDLCDLRPDLRV